MFITINGGYLNIKRNILYDQNSMMTFVRTLTDRDIIIRSLYLQRDNRRQLYIFAPIRNNLNRRIINMIETLCLR